MLRRRLRALALAGPALALLASLGCGETLRSRAHPGLAQAETWPRTVAVAPFRLTGPLKEADGAEAPGPAAAALVAQRLADALAERGVSVVPPEAVAGELNLERASGEKLDAASAARRVAEAFGADGLALGSLWRYEERSGRAGGSLRAAAVGFEVTLHAAPSGEALWSAIFDERQQALTDNLFNAARYPGGGFRWLTAEELAAWGARETAGAAPVEP